MSTNPLKGKIPQTLAMRTAQEWADRGNRILAGEQPFEHGKLAGQFMRRDDVHWVVRNGKFVIEFKP